MHLKLILIGMKRHERVTNRGLHNTRIALVTSEQKLEGVKVIVRHNKAVDETAEVLD